MCRATKIKYWCRSFCITLNALDKVLDQRDIDLRVWGEKERNDFHTIFGTDGEKVFHIDMPIKGVPHIIEMKAVDVMRDCIR